MANVRDDLGMTRLSTKEPTLNFRERRHLGSKLKDIYAPVTGTDAVLPDNLTALLERLQAAEDAAGPACKQAA